MSLFKKHLFFLTLSTMSFSVLANTHPYYLIAPDCLLAKTHYSYEKVASKNILSLIKTDETGLQKLIEAKKHSICGGFKNVSADFKTEQNAQQFLSQHLTKLMTVKKTTFPQAMRYEKTVNQVFNQLMPELIWKNLSVLTQFPDRYANSNHGKEAMTWLKNEVETIANDHHRSDIKAYFVATGNYVQPSLVVKIGNEDNHDSAVVIGAHMDTLSGRFSNKPGADDDGSGSMSAFSAYKTLVESGISFKKPVYFIWYAAEELGLVGSQYVVKAFKANHIPVYAVMQLDMTGYAPKKDLTIWLMDDYVSSELTQFTNTLVNTYVKHGVKHSSCGYACSDHASWTEEGIASVMPFEAKMGADDPYIHTSNDKMEYLNLDHMTDFAKLAIAFTIELAEPNNV